MCAVEREGKDITAILADFEARSSALTLGGELEKGKGSEF